MANLDKWQSMLSIVNQHSKFLISEPRKNAAQQFNKLVWQRLLTENILVFLLQFSGLKLSTLSLDPSPLWLATGTACGFLFLRGYSVLPGIFLGSFLPFYLQKIGFLSAMNYAAVLTLQGLFLLWFSYRYLKPTLIFNSLVLFTKFIIFTAVLTAITSMMFVIICHFRASHADYPVQYWLTWWLANFNAILILSTALVTWDAYVPDFFALQFWKNFILLFGLLFLALLALVFSHTPTLTTGLALLIVLFNVFVSARFGWCGAMTSAFLSAIVFCFAGFMNAVVFSTYSAYLTLVLVQLFLGVNTIIGLSIALKFTGIAANNVRAHT